MTNTQLLIAVGLPVIVVLLGIFLNQKSVSELNTRMESRFDKVESRMDKIESRLDRIDADLRQFFSITGRLEGRMDSIEKR